MRRVAVFFEDELSRRLDGLVDQGAEAGRADFDAGMGEGVAQEVFCRGATADVANADDEYPANQHNLP
ncbi:hypothetical protein D9M72_604950 [compost metagenome]